MNPSVDAQAVVERGYNCGSMQRRQALRYLAGSPSLFGLPAAAAVVNPLPDTRLSSADPDKYWALIRKTQFYLPGERVFLNNGSLGIAPRPVIAAVTRFLEDSAGLLLPNDEYPRWGYETLDAHREEMATYLGCAKDQLAFTHNATEAMSFIAAGLDLKARDEVVMTDQEHGSGKSPWHVKRARHGIEVREVPLPLPPKSPEQLADLLVSAIGPRTRVLFFSGITTTTGLVLPMKLICEAARAKGVITIVDGAHVNGQIPIRIDDIGCDFYAGSPHKWMFAPAGCGILWGRPEMLERLWPTVVTGGWDNQERKAARFMFVGTNNRSIFEGMIAGVRFARSIGVDRIYDRLHSVARLMRRKAAESPQTELLTPDDDRMYGSLVTFKTKSTDFKKFGELCKKRRIWTIGGERIRLSAHIHTRPSDVELFFETLRECRV